MNRFLHGLRMTSLAMAGGALGAVCSVVMVRILDAHFLFDTRPIVDGALGIWKGVGLPVPYLGTAFVAGAALTGFVAGALLVLYPVFGGGVPTRARPPSA